MARLRGRLTIAEMEERLAELKDGGDRRELVELKNELRYERWVSRGGPDQEAASLAQTGEHTNRATKALYERYMAERD